MEQLEYRVGDKFSTIPSPEYNLQTIVAEKFLKVYDDAKTLEGACFNRDGDLFFTSTQGFSIFRVNMKTKELTTVFREEGVRPGAVKFHKDGRIFAACLTNETMGGVLTMNPDGSDPKWIVRGYSVDDLVFDKDGGFYFTDFVGNFRNPLGGVYYVTPDYKKVIPFCQHMCQPNGIALSTDGKILWVTEYQAQRLHRFNLETDRACIPYRFTGFAGPDSCSIDEDDNLYVAMPEQGRIMVFNYYGSPIGQIVTPGREYGRHTFTTHPMVRPDSRELYITCKDASEDTEGSWIFRAGAFAKGNPNAYQFQK